MTPTTFQPGDRVRYSSSFCRSIGAATSDLPRRRGTVISTQPLPGGDRQLVEIAWDHTLASLSGGLPEFVARVISANLERLPANQRDRLQPLERMIGEEALLQFAASSDWELRTLAEGCLYADRSCRIGGTLALAMRRASGVQLGALLSRMRRDGVGLIADVPRWLNQNQAEALECLGTREGSVLR